MTEPAKPQSQPAALLVLVVTAFFIAAIYAIVYWFWVIPTTLSLAAGIGGGIVYLILCYWLPPSEKDWDRVTEREGFGREGAGWMILFMLLLLPGYFVANVLAEAARTIRG